MARKRLARPIHSDTSHSTRLARGEIRAYTERMSASAKRGGRAAIEVEAVVAQVKTMADGGIRVAFDLPETAAMQAAQFIECKRIGAALQLNITVLQSLANGKTQTQPRAARSPLGMAGG